MSDCECTFSSALRDKLVTKVNGGVKTWITNDELFVSIRLTEYGLESHYSISDILSKILNGYTTDQALYEVLKNHKKTINKLFFKH